MDTGSNKKSAWPYALLGAACFGLGIAATIAWTSDTRPPHDNHTYNLNTITPKNTWFINPFQYQQGSPGIYFEVGVCKLCGQQTHLAQINRTTVKVYLLPKYDPTSSISPGTVPAIVIPFKDYPLRGTNYTQ